MKPHGIENYSAEATINTSKCEHRTYVLEYFYWPAFYQRIFLKLGLIQCMRSRSYAILYFQNRPTLESVLSITADRVNECFLLKISLK